MESAMNQEKLNIRVFRDDDEGAVASLWRSVFPGNPAWNHPETDIARKRAVQREFLLVGERPDEGVVATVMGGYDGHRGWIYYLAVAPGHRGRGYGREMMTVIESLLEERGCHKVNLQVRADNPQAVAFYESAGYEVEDRISMGKRMG